MARWGVLLALLALVACKPEFPAAPGQRLGCASDTECPEDHACHPVLGLCLDGLPDCATPEGLQPDGTPCGSGARVCREGACIRSECGDGVVDPRLDEQCDGAEGCHASCLLNVCGDGIVLGDEVCDGEVAFGRCASDCSKIEVCGDGEVDELEECDGTEGCHVDCTVNICGDEKILAGVEACDGPGGLQAGETCRADCGRIERCGDGVVDTSEECDDANGNPSDACSNTCTEVVWTPRIRAGLGPQFGDPQTAFAVQPQKAVLHIDGSVYLSNGLMIVRIVDGQIVPYAGSITAGQPLVEGGIAAVADLAPVSPFVVDSLGRAIFPAGLTGGELFRVELDGTLARVAGGGPGTVDGGPATQASFSLIFGIAIGPTGELYVSDFGGQRVVRVTPSGAVFTVLNGVSIAGIAVDETGALYLTDVVNDELLRMPNPAVPAGIEVIATGLDNPGDVTVAGGRVCFAENERHRVRCVEDGALEVVAGTGVAGFSGDGGAATSAQLNRPVGVTLDGPDRLLIGDSFNARLREVLRSGATETIDTLVGTGDGLPVDGVLATSAFVGVLSDLAFDSTGLLHLLDRDTGRLIRRRADLTLEIVVDGAFTAPYALAFAGGDAYVTDATGLWRVVGSGAELVVALDAPPPFPCDPAGGARPDLDVDRDGRLLFIQPGDASVYRRELNGDVARVAGDGTDTSGAPEGAALALPLCSPTEIAADGAGGFYILEPSQSRLRHVDAAGALTLAVADFASSRAVSVAPGGDLVYAVLDGNQQSVRARDAAGVESFLVDPNTTGFTGDGGPASSARLNPISATRTGPGGALFLLSETRVRRIEAGLIEAVFNADYPPHGVGLTTPLFSPPALVTLPAGASLVPSGSHLTLLDGDRSRVVAGYPDGVELDAAPRAARFARRLDSVRGIAFDDDRTVFLAEPNEILALDIVDELDPETWTLRVFASGFAELAGLDFAGGELYAADRGRHVIVALDDSASQRLVYGAPSTPGLIDGLLFAPAAVVVADDGALFVGDAGNRVLRVVPGQASALVVGTGEPASSGDGAPSVNFPVEAPQGLAIDTHGNLLVTSTRALRLITPGASGVVDGGGAVHTLYGAAPRDTFPEDSTACLSGVAERADGRIDLLDSCQGFYVELERTP
jgi:cysteine-rich repeat protein